MGFLSAATRPFIHLALGFLLLQGAYGTNPADVENQFLWATAPPSEFLTFNEDFSSLNADRISPWINVSLGFVKDGVLLTKEEAIERFREDFHESAGNLLEMNLHYNYGDYYGRNTFQADCWVDYRLRENGVDTWYRFHNEFVFQIIDSAWFLVQSEYIATESDITLDYESYLENSVDAPPWAQNVRSDLSGSQFAGVTSWPLLIGTNFTGEDELHPISGKMTNGGVWNLRYAVEAGKPVVFFFFTVQGLSMTLPEELDAQMDFLKGLYDRFGYDELYIFGVTDDTLENVQWVFHGTDISYMALLVDEGSALHANMNIDTEPYIVVLDSFGTIAALTKTWHPSSLDLIESRILEAVEYANAQT